MAVNTAAGSTFAIGPQGTYASTVDWTDTESNIIDAFEALVWTEVGEVEDLGEFGDEASEITFTALANDRRGHSDPIADQCSRPSKWSQGKIAQILHLQRESR